MVTPTAVFRFLCRFVSLKVNGKLLKGFLGNEPLDVCHTHTDTTEKPEEPDDGEGSVFTERTQVSMRVSF